MQKYEYDLRFGRSTCQKHCTVCDLDAKVLIFLRFWKVYVSKVLYCVRLGCNRFNIPSVLDGLGVKSAILCATWKVFALHHCLPMLHLAIPRRVHHSSAGPKANGRATGIELWLVEC